MKSIHDPRMLMPRIFVSHRSSDSGVAQALVLLLRSALNIPPRDIRCTSVDGHRLAGGAQTDDELRREILEAVIVIGLISPASIESAYVLFELGARWGANKRLIPLLAPGAEADHLKGPLGSMNALRVQSEEEQLHQLLGEIAAELGTELNSPASFLGQLRALAAMPAQAPQSNAPQVLPDLDLNEEHLMVIKYFAEADWKYKSVWHMAVDLKLKQVRVQNLVDQLRDAGYLGISAGQSGPNYHLARRGREYAVEHGLA